MQSPGDLDRTFALLGCALAFLGVALGAFGAHGLRNSVSQADLATWDTAVRYQLVHALALLWLAWAVERWPGASTAAAGWAFVAGVLIFSGSLYALVLSGQRWLGAVTPLGGLAFLTGWALLAWGILRR